MVGQQHHGGSLWIRSDAPQETYVVCINMHACIPLDPTSVAWEAGCFCDPTDLSSGLPGKTTCHRLPRTWKIHCASWIQICFAVGYVWSWMFWKKNTSHFLYPSPTYSSSMSAEPVPTMPVVESVTTPIRFTREDWLRYLNYVADEKICASCWASQLRKFLDRSSGNKTYFYAL